MNATITQIQWCLTADKVTLLVLVDVCTISSPLIGCQIISRLHIQLSWYPDWLDTFRTVLYLYFNTESKNWEEKVLLPQRSCSLLFSVINIITRSGSAQKLNILSHTASRRHRCVIFILPGDFTNKNLFFICSEFLFFISGLWCLFKVIE